MICWRMSRISKITIIIAGLWFVSAVAFVARPSGLAQLLSMVLTLGLLGFGLVSFIQVFTRWRREHWRSVIPMGACVLAVILAPEVGAMIQDISFRRALPHYESLIQQIESGNLPVSDELRSVPRTKDISAYSVLAQRSTNGVLMVEFLTGRGFPVKHSGYLYSSSGAIERDSRIDSRWPKRRQVRPLWFRISD